MAPARKNNEKESDEKRGSSVSTEKIGSPIKSGTEEGTRKKSEAKSAKHIPHYHDTHEDYVSVSKARLREISTVGALQEGAGGLGVFLISGNFWMAITLLAEHTNNLKPYYSWLVLNGIFIVVGCFLLLVGYKLYNLKSKYINELFNKAYFEVESAKE